MAKNTYFELNEDGLLKKTGLVSSLTSDQLEQIERNNARIMSNRSTYTGVHVQIPAGFVQYFLENNPSWDNRKFVISSFMSKEIITGEVYDQPRNSTNTFTSIKNSPTTTLVRMPGHLALDMMRDIERYKKNP